MVETRIDAGLRRLARAFKRDLEDALDGLQDSREILVRLRDRGKRAGLGTAPTAWVQQLDATISSIEHEINDVERRLTDDVEIAKQQDIPKPTDLTLPSRQLIGERPAKGGKG